MRTIPPQNISDSLGKLPPQAIELEESILGSVLIDKSAFSIIIEILRPHHFYSDQHKEIYGAIFNLWVTDRPIDMRTVVHQLRESGKLEIVGGAYYIAELASKVSSAANIEYHARILIEYSLKRDLIQIASQIHHDAYEDVTDVFELLDRTNDSLKSLQISPTRSLDQYIKNHSFDTSQPPEEDDTILYLQDISIGSKENIITITGRSKSRKTVAASAIATSIFSGSHLGFTSDLPEDARILHIDTEQGYKHYYHSVKRIFDAAAIDVPARFTSIHTRDADIPLRLELLSYMVEAIKPTVLIVDGVTDLVYDINSQEESTKIGELFLRLSSTYHMLIIAVIHTTKTTGFMTGAIGTILEKKSETVIKVELVEDNKMASNISCQFSRNKPFADFTIVADDQGKYSVMANDQIERPSTNNLSMPGNHSDEQHATLLNQVFGLSELIDANHLKKRLRSCSLTTLNYQITNKTLPIFIKFYLDRVQIIENGAGMYAKPVRVPPDSQLKINNEGDDSPF